METKFHDIYIELIQNFHRLSESNSAVLKDKLIFSEDPSFIEEAITEAIMRSPKIITLRPDAKYFLIINFHQMVLVPVAGVKGLNSVEGREIREAVKDDVHRIVNAANEIREGNAEVTGGDILKTINSLWDALKVNQPRFWGGDTHEQ